MEGSMYHATSHGDLCPEGFFCLAGDDCSSNSSLCEVGVCQPATEENCIQGTYYVCCYVHRFAYY